MVAHRNALSMGDALLSKIKPYVKGNLKRKDPEDIFVDWLINALTVHEQLGYASAFAPFDTYFSSPEQFRESFTRFHENELAGVIVGRSSTKQLLSRSLQNLLRFASDDVRPHAFSDDEYEAETQVIDEFVFDLFNALLDVNSDAACEWAALAFNSEAGLSSTRTMGMTPTPIQFFLNLNADDTSTTARVNFYKSLLEWCRRNADEQEIDAYVFEILLLTLRSETDPYRARKQIAHLSNMIKPHKRCSRSVLSAVDSEIFHLAEELGEDETEEWAHRLHDEVDAEFSFLLSSLPEDQKAIWRAHQLLMYAFAEELTLREDSRPFEGFKPIFDPVGSAIDTFKISIEEMSDAMRAYPSRPGLAA